MAGVMVRMITGDNINTAKAIARVRTLHTHFLLSIPHTLLALPHPSPQLGRLHPLTHISYLKLQDCGILTPGGLAIEGPVFRNLKPAEVDALLPRIQVCFTSPPHNTLSENSSHLVENSDLLSTCTSLTLLSFSQVMARSSPEDKYLMVTRLNGTSPIPTTPHLPPHFSSHHSPPKPLPSRLASHFRVCVCLGANLPKDEKAWLEKHPGRSWATEKDDLLPGYYDVRSPEQP